LRPEASFHGRPFRARRFGAALFAAAACLALAPATSAATWVPQSPTGAPPAPGYSQTGSPYDAANDRLVFFSIDDGGSLPRPTDVWVLAGATGGSSSWTQLAPTGGPPLGRYAHSVVYAPSSNRIVVLGGCPSNCGVALQDVWVLSNANGLGGTPAWTQLPAPHPFPTEGQSAVYDDANNRMIVFGGQNGFNTPVNLVRVLENADGTGFGAPAWTVLAPSGVPPAPRESVGAAYDASSNRMIVFGGATLVCCAFVAATYNDVWVLTNANGLGGTPAWVQLAPLGTPPPQRYWTTAVYDASANRLIVFGGVDGQGGPAAPYYNDVWVLSHANGLGGTPEWAQLAPFGAPPTARFGHVAGYNSATASMVVAMGRTDVPTFTLFNDVWVFQEDGTAPAITIASPADGASYLLGSTLLADYSCEDEPGGSGLASCIGPVADGASLDTSTVGPRSFTVTAADEAGNAASLTHDYAIVYGFAGFFSPVDNPPTLNRLKAGAAVPVKFSLGGDQGLDIFAAGYPKSQLIPCDSAAAVVGIEETVTAGSSTLTYNAETERYTYVWKTDRSWAGTCRQLVVKLDDGTSHRANFVFG